MPLRSTLEQRQHLDGAAGGHRDGGARRKKRLRRGTGALGGGEVGARVGEAVQRGANPRPPQQLVHRAGPPFRQQRAP